MGCSGDYADYQFQLKQIKQLVTTDFQYDDGRSLRPSELHTWLTRAAYQRRNELKPLWNHYVIGGIEGNKPFLGELFYLLLLPNLSSNFSKL